jgi:hypothetical protein
MKTSTHGSCFPPVEGGRPVYGGAGCGGGAFILCGGLRSYSEM